MFFSPSTSWWLKSDTLRVTIIAIFLAAVLPDSALELSDHKELSGMEPVPRPQCKSNYMPKEIGKPYNQRPMYPKLLMVP